MSPSLKDRQAQIDSVKLVAELLPDLPDAVVMSLRDGEEALRGLYERDKKRQETPVQVLPADASDAEIRSARRRSAIQHGDQTYLPSVSTEGFVPVPVALLRSALFAVVKTPTDELLVGEKLPCHGRFTVIQSGLPLKDRDLHVYAACLQQYGESRPLGTWVDISYWQLADAMGVPYGVNVHQAIRSALTRLSTVLVHVRAEMKSYPGRHLLMVDFSSGDAGGGSPQGSDRIRFCVPDAIAELYGPNLWSSVPLKALAATDGLARWLVGFYCTHAKPYALSVDELKRLSGASGSLSAFRKRLRDALESLKQEIIPEAARVAGSDFDDQGYVTVRLVRWMARAGSSKTASSRRGVR